MDNPDLDRELDYFSYRNVTPEHYSDYALPGYFAQVLPQDRNAAILDIGCGFGQMLNALRSLGYVTLRGVDISQSAVEHCEAIGLNVYRIEDLDTFSELSTERFDLIVMNHVLEHLCKSEIINTLSKIRSKLLRQGGKLLITTPNAQSPTGCYWAYEDFTHSTIFTAGSLYYVLRSAGFEQVNFVDPLGIAGSHLLVRLLRRLLIPIYNWRVGLWNLITNSSFHEPSPKVYTYELKALAW